MAERCPFTAVWFPGDENIEVNCVWPADHEPADVHCDETKGPYEEDGWFITLPSSPA
jgi:hypothetical protein